MVRISFCAFSKDERHNIYHTADFSKELFEVKLVIQGEFLYDNYSSRIYINLESFLLRTT